MPAAISATPDATNVREATATAAVQATEGNAEAIWNIEVNSAELFSALHTEKDVEQYEGDHVLVAYDNAPADGMQFAVFDLTVRKTRAAKAAFDWANLALVLADGSTYSRAEDAFLSDHDYSRISGTKLSLSSAQGYACFEIPTGETLDGAAFRYTDENGEFTFAVSQ